MKVAKLICAIIASLMLICSGCATIFSGGPESITMQSDPPGATYQYGPYQGKTPDTLAVARGSLSHFAMFSKAGYEQKTVPVETGIQGVTWVDILFWPGFIVDFVTGNAFKVNSPVVNAVLEPVAQPVAVPQQTPVPPKPATPSM